jgi:polysaccharide biosynthesis protein PslH
VRVLVLVTRFPAPPWRGDQVRAYHHLRVLAARHAITCAALVVRPPPAAARAEIEAMGVRVEVIRLGVLGTIPALARILTGDRRPIQVLLYARRRAAARVAELVAREPFDVVHAQLVRTLAYLPPRMPVVVDLVDALSRNLARRAELEGGARGRLLAWEAGRLAASEQAIVATGAPCLVVSESERAALPAGGNVQIVPNGVDTEAFAFDARARPPARLVFGGNLGYFPNADAAEWLARDILPRVRAARPDAELRLVGARPAAAVRALGARPGVAVVGAVPAMAPELAAATVAVVPLRAGSGLQNKVLEAMAVGTPVVATRLAAAGLVVAPGEHLLVADDAAGLAAGVLALLGDPARARAMAHAARALVLARYRWESSAAAVEAAWTAAAPP